MKLRTQASALRADFARNPSATTRITLTVWRLGAWAHADRTPLGWLGRRGHGLLDFVWTRAVIGAELPRSVQVGPGITLPHSARGVVLHPECRIGRGATLFHQVTIGTRNGSCAPTIGDDVELGVGAKVLGAVTVGSHAAVGAGAVVVHDVPSGETWVGVPARAVQRRPRGLRSPDPDQVPDPVSAVRRVRALPSRSGEPAAGSTERPS